MKKRVLAGAIAAAIAGPAYADPPPLLDLPQVFCFRITDVERTLDAGGAVIEDSFLFEFEVLNWTFRDADALKLDLNTATSAGVTIGGASIDADGRGGTTGTDADNPAYGELGQPNAVPEPVFHDGRGTAAHPNDWRVLNQTTQQVFFDAEVEFTEITDDYGYGGDQGYGRFTSYQADPNGTPIPNQALLFGQGRVPGTGEDATGDSAVDGGPGPYTPGPDDGDPLVDGAPVSLPGDGNSLDGFVVQVDGLGVGDKVSFNWQLLQASGFFYSEDPGDCVLVPTQCFTSIGTGNGIDNFGFGIASIERMAVGGDPGGPLFEGNSGFNQNPVTFFGDVFSLKNPAEVAAEFGGGSHGQYQDPTQRGLFGALPQAQRLAAGIPEPTTLALMGLGLGLAGWRRSKRY